MPTEVMFFWLLFGSAGAFLGALTRNNGPFDILKRAREEWSELIFSAILVFLIGFLSYTISSSFWLTRSLSVALTMFFVASFVGLKWKFAPDLGAGFMTKLLSCSLCVSFWFNVIVWVLLFGLWSWLLVLIPASTMLSLYLLSMIGVNDVQSPR